MLDEVVVVGSFNMHDGMRSVIQIGKISQCTSTGRFSKATLASRGP